MASIFLACCLILVNAHLILAATADHVEENLARRLGTMHVLDNAPSPSPSPSEAIRGEESGAQEQDLEKHHRHHHHHRPSDGSIAGGGVIIGGLATFFLVAVFCYIRATRRKNFVEPAGSPTETPVRRKDIESGFKQTPRYTNS